MVLVPAAGPNPDSVAARPALPSPGGSPASQVAQPAVAPGWDSRADQFRNQEWEMAQKLLVAARGLLNRIQLQPGLEPSVSDLTRMLDLASRLGRLSCGLELEKTEISGPGGGPVSIEVEVALRKIYGEPLPGEVVDCEAVKV
jgi:hypothetical protein